MSYTGNPVCEKSANAQKAGAVMSEQGFVISAKDLSPEQLLISAQETKPNSRIDESSF